MGRETRSAKRGAGCHRRRWLTLLPAALKGFRSDRSWGSRLRRRTLLDGETTRAVASPGLARSVLTREFKTKRLGELLRKADDHERLALRRETGPGAVAKHDRTAEHLKRFVKILLVEGLVTKRPLEFRIIQKTGQIGPHGGCYGGRRAPPVRLDASGLVATYASGRRASRRYRFTRLYSCSTITA